MFSGDGGRSAARPHREGCRAKDLSAAELTEIITADEGDL